jgi:cellulose synthase/poly-beta-1,6-N-acetylglucosamine synthase-like glycosyltransferase
MDLIILIFSIFLIILGLGILRNWKVKSPVQNTYSILIACRNEESNLPELFQALRKIDYPSDKFEIIIVDDTSDDDSFKLISTFCDNSENAKCFLLGEKDTEYFGKKAALKKAADNAIFDFLLFTDADCFPQPDWLKSFNKLISQKTAMVVGNYKEQNASSFRIFSNRMSFAIYAGTIGLNCPFSASGGNMAVRKKAFLEVGGYDKIKHHLAGDDKLLLNLIIKTNWQIAYNADPVVQTKAVSDKKYSHHQQKRRYGKFGMSSTGFKILSILFFLFYLYLPVRFFVFKDWKSILVYLFGALFFWMMNLIRHKFRFRMIDLIFILIYPYYLIIYSLLGTFSTWSWKN